MGNIPASCLFREIPPLEVAVSTPPQSGLAGSCPVKTVSELESRSPITAKLKVIAESIVFLMWLTWLAAMQLPLKPESCGSFV